MRTIQELKKLGILKDHNIPTYLEMQELFEDGENRVGVVQATGTGKSFVAFQFLYDNVFSVNNEVYSSKEFFKDGKYRAKRAVVLEPRQGIVFRFNELCEKLCRELHVPFDDVIVARYDQLKLLTDEELKLLDFDYIILDEFHRLGAEGRGKVTQRVLRANPNAKVLGLTATPIRYLDKKRDMGDELFGDNIVRGLNVAEAIREGVLPNPEYVMAVRSYEETAKIIEDKINAIRDKKTRELYKKELEELRRHPEFAKGLKETFERKIQKKNGKFIAFCADTEKLKSLRDEIENNGLLSGVNQNVKIYQITFRDKKEDVERTIKAFEEDKSDSFKVMLAVDMFNEGIHISDVDGCFLFRPTISPEIYTQQIGRVLSVSDNKDFRPQIFDVVNNLQNYEKMILAFEAERSDGVRHDATDFDQTIIPFEITGSDEDFFARMMELSEKVAACVASKKELIECAKRYFKEYGNLRVKTDYVDFETEIRFGEWIGRTIRNYNIDKNLVSKDIVEELIKIDPKVFTYTLKTAVRERNAKILRFAQIYFEKYGNLAVKEQNNARDPITKELVNPYLYTQLIEIKKFLRDNKRSGSKYPADLIKNLTDIDPRIFEDNYSKNLDREIKEAKILRCAKIYFEKHGNLAIKGKNSNNAEQYILVDPETKDTVDLSLVFEQLKVFIKKPKGRYNYSQDLVEKLLEIDPRIFEEDYTLHIVQEKREAQIIKFAQIYFDKNGNLAVPCCEKMIDDETGEICNLGDELRMVRLFRKGCTATASYSQDLCDRLEKIDPRVFEKDYTENLARESAERQIYRCAISYKEQYGNLGVYTDERGIVVDEETGEKINLGLKLGAVRLFVNGNAHNGRYSQELIEKLEELDPRVFERNYTRNLERERKNKELS